MTGINHELADKVVSLASRRKQQPSVDVVAAALDAPLLHLHRADVQILIQYSAILDEVYALVSTPAPRGTPITSARAAAADTYIASEGMRIGSAVIHLTTAEVLEAAEFFGIEVIND